MNTPSHIPSRAADRPDEARTVVTGLGVMSGLGHDVETFWAGLIAGRSAIRRWRDKDPRIASKIGGDQSDFALPAYLATVRAAAPDRVDTLPRLVRGTSVGTQLTACAALQAYVDAGADAGIDPDRFGHLCAGQNLSLGYFADNLAAFEEHPDDIEPLLGMIALDTDLVGVVNELLTLRGPNALIGGACASGNLALVSAIDLIRAGRADAVVVTGAAASFHAMILHAWAMIEATTFKSFDDAPERASRPFDALREGFAPSEAAAAVVIESLASARRRGATVRAELLGGATTSDACRLPKPHREGQVAAMRLAMADAGVEAHQIDYVNAHATSTPLGDAVEVAAIREALGERARQIPVNATKSMTGHSLTSAAVVELVATVLQIERSVVHPTINQEVADPELDLDFVPNVARPHRIGVALSNSFGFGGINACVAVGRAP